MAALVSVATALMQKAMKSAATNGFSMLTLEALRIAILDRMLVLRAEVTRSIAVSTMDHKVVATINVLAKTTRLVCVLTPCSREATIAASMKSGTENFSNTQKSIPPQNVI
jgi:hypothetical protein